MSPKETPLPNPFESTLFAAELSDSIPQIDLHGMRGNIAVSEAETFLHRSFMDGEEAVKIIHGRGTGILKTLIEKLLKENPEIIASYRGSTKPGEAGAVILVAMHRK